MDVLLDSARRGSVRLASVAFMAILFMSCTTTNGADLPPTPAPVAKPLIGEQQAVKVALYIATNETWSTVLESPKRASGKLMTLRAAEAINGETIIASNIFPPPDTMVWFMTVDGSWRVDGGPVNNYGKPLATPPPVYHYFVIINANTGEALEWW